MAVSGDDARFEVGGEVEAAVRGGLFPAKITRTSSRRAGFAVEYKAVSEKTQSKRMRPLEEVVEASALRPSPPCEKGRRSGFEIGDEVDAFYGGAWREGVVVQASRDCSRFSVHLRVLNLRLDSQASEMRLHREWVRGRWVPPLPKKISAPTSEATKARKNEKLFNEGMLVEVGCDEDGFRGSWYAATIVKATGKNKYVVQYKSLRTEADKEFVREEFDARRIRPYPPEALVVDGFNVNERVDAFHNDGWWEGTVCKVLHKGRYKVYFEADDEEMVFEHFDLRPHQDWINGIWVMAST